jgi:hypothetical protein
MSAAEYRGVVEASFAEYRAHYREPIFAILREGALVPALYRAFKYWGIGLENINFRPNPVSLADVQVTVELLKGRVAFNVGLGSLSLGIANPNWTEVDLLWEHRPCRA